MAIFKIERGVGGLRNATFPFVSWHSLLPFYDLGPSQLRRLQSLSTQARLLPLCSVCWPLMDNSGQQELLQIGQHTDLSPISPSPVPDQRSI